MRGRLVELEEASVVELDEGVAGAQGVPHRLRLFLLCGQSLQHAERLSLQFTKNVVQELVT